MASWETVKEAVTQDADLCRKIRAAMRQRRDALLTGHPDWVAGYDKIIDQHRELAERLDLEYHQHRWIGS